jgi:hypothetical protein
MSAGQGHRRSVGSPKAGSCAAAGRWASPVLARADDAAHGAVRGAAWDAFSEAWDSVWGRSCSGEGGSSGSGACAGRQSARRKPLSLVRL